MRRTCPLIAVSLAIAFLLVSTVPAGAYKARPWSPRKPDTYPARLVSENVTIAVDPLHTDVAAAQVFDKKDMVTRGIMPLAIVVFNDNDFPLLIEGESIELIQEDERLRTVTPLEAVGKLFPKSAKSVLSSPTGIPKTGASGPNQDALEDFYHKFFGQKVVPPKGAAAGFLYLRVPERKDLSEYLSAARVYIPEIARQDTSASLIFFEIDLKSAFSPVGGVR